VNGGAFLLLALALVAAFGDWVAVGREQKALEYLCKPLTLGLLTATAVALDPDESEVRWWFVVALGLCLLGDIFLMLPQDVFVPGLTAFLLGHLAYIVGMLVDGLVASRFGIGLVIVSLAIVVIGLPIARAVRAGPEPELTGPVLAYMGVISLMVACAIGVGHPAGVAGAGFFYASDSLIAWNRFIGETRRGHLAIMVTYHLAQVGLVLSLV
jgi:uncharacterized membrane protein YhhN